MEDLQDIINKVNHSLVPDYCITFIKGQIKPEHYEALKKEYPYEKEVPMLNHILMKEIIVVQLTKEPQS